ncbi:MAG: phage portal protein [Anaerolineae bacterium]|nr:phage portal protein [Anaerolineae bacterium]
MTSALNRKIRRAFLLPRTSIRGSVFGEVTVNIFDRVLSRLGLQRARSAFLPPMVVNQEATVRGNDVPAMRNVALLRSVADQVNVIRAAINAKKRQIAQLQIEVTGPSEARCAELMTLLTQPVPGLSWRQWLGKVLEDVLVLDAGAVYVWQRRGGALYGLLPIDGSTIRPLGNGLIPTPPAPAYEQWIGGVRYAQLTTQELQYAVMNPRTHSLYGFSPTEAVLHTASIVLGRLEGAGDALDDSNVPAFFGEVPEGWQPDQIKTWQEYWDAVTKQQTHRGVWGPAGADVKFPPRVEIDTKFDVWLTQLVLAIFEVQPQELGLTADVNRATGEVQEQITQRRSVKPLAALVAEMVNGAFAATGNEGYELTFPELLKRSRDEIRSDAQTYVPMGVISAQEIREELGYTGPAPAEEKSESAGERVSEEEEEDEAAEEDGEAGERVSGEAEEGDAEEEKPARRVLRGMTTIPITPPAPDERATLLALQETLQREYLVASQQVAVEALLEELRAAQERGEAITPALVERVAGEVSAAHGEAVRPVIIRSLQALAQDGVLAGAEAFTAAVKITLDWTLANTDAANWARLYGGKLCKGLDATTKARIAAEVAAWAEAREGMPDLVKRIAAIISSPVRAEIIAQTEPTNAYAAGNIAAWRQAEDELGLEITQVWNTANDDLVCPICGPLNQQEKPIGQPFTATGNASILAPAAHPRCRCWLTAITRIATKRLAYLRRLYAGRD